MTHYLPQVLFLISASFDRSTMYFTSPPSIPNKTPPSTKSLKTTMPCIGPTADRQGRGHVILGDVYFTSYAVSFNF
jgi:hypothetical protein